MHRSERSSRIAERFMQKERHQHPSFSASLLEKIYRSFDETEAGTEEELKFKKQSISCVRSSRVTADNDHHDTSLDSSSVRFSSPDTESVFAAKRLTLTPPLPRPKPVRTSVSARSEKSKGTEEKQRTLFFEQRRTLPPQLDDYSNNQGYPSIEDPRERHEEGIVRSKSRALKIYENLKQPISPGGCLVNFINSLFTPTNMKKAKKSASIGRSVDDINNPKSGQASLCPPACSFSTSCLTKNSPERSERNGPKRSVHFNPTMSNVNVLDHEERKPCPTRPPVPNVDNGGRSYPRKLDDKKRHNVTVAARELFKDYHWRHKRNNVATTSSLREKSYHNGDDDDDDASSCSSSDLFELEHLTVIGNDIRYSEELPVYETTRFKLGGRLVIPNGLIL